MKRRLARWFRILERPGDEFRRLDKRSFEEVLPDYLVQLLLVSIATAVASYLMFIGRAAYNDLFTVIDINYWRLMNYAGGRATALFFLYLFSGTFGLFLLSIVTHLFVRKKYTRTLELLFYSLSPFLLFGWLYSAAPALLLWSLILLIIGARTQRGKKIRRTSVQQRD